MYCTTLTSSSYNWDCLAPIHLNCMCQYTCNTVQLLYCMLYCYCLGCSAFGSASRVRVDIAVGRAIRDPLRTRAHRLLLLRFGAHKLIDRTRTKVCILVSYKSLLCGSISLLLLMRWLVLSSYLSVCISSYLGFSKRVVTGSVATAWRCTAGSTTWPFATGRRRRRCCSSRPPRSRAPSCSLCAR